VFGGCGSAVLAAKFTSTPDNVQLGIGFVGVALAFGLTVLTGAYAFGHVSGGHFNPAVTIGLAVAKRFEWRGVGPYVITQLVAATVAGAVLFLIAMGRGGFNATLVRAGGFASNGYGSRSPHHFSLLACLFTEIILTAVFLYIILGATDDRAPKGFAPIAIGLGLTLIHLVSIPVTNTSVNPARSLGVAWFAGGGALAQLWLFIVAPIIGAAIAGASYAAITGANAPVEVVAATYPEVSSPAGPLEGIANNPDIGVSGRPDVSRPNLPEEGIANNPDVG